MKLQVEDWAEIKRIREGNLGKNGNVLDWNVYHLLECLFKLAKPSPPQCPVCDSYKLKCAEGHSWETPDGH